MKLFKTSNIETKKNCHELLGFEVPSVVWAKRVDKFESKFAEFIGFDLTTCL